MFPLVKVRKTKSSLCLAKEGGEEVSHEDQYEDEQNKENENKEDQKVMKDITTKINAKQIN